MEGLLYSYIPLPSLRRKTPTLDALMRLKTGSTPETAQLNAQLTLNHVVFDEYEGAFDSYERVYGAVCAWSCECGGVWRRTASSRVDRVCWDEFMSREDDFHSRSWRSLLPLVHQEHD
jgi:hypothetical protein